MAKSQHEALQIEFPEVKKRTFLFTKVTTGLVYDVIDPGTSRDEQDYLEIGQEVMDLVEKGYKNICWLARRLDRDRKSQC